MMGKPGGAYIAHTKIVKKPDYEKIIAILDFAFYLQPDVGVAIYLY